MQSQVYTQDDLKQILQKMITQKQPPPLVCPTPTPALCEEVVQEEIVPDLPLTQEIEKLQQENETLLNELEKAKAAKKKSPQVQQEIEQYKETINNLTIALDAAIAENQPHPEVEKAKVAIRELSVALQEAKEQLKKRDEELVRKDSSSQDSQEQKLRILRFISDKKELEDKITALTCEKATLAARLQNLQQKNTLGDETQTALTNQLTELTAILEETSKTLESTQQALQEKQNLAASHESQNQKLMQELQHLQESHEELRTRAIRAEEISSELESRLEVAEKNHTQDFAVAQACLVERSQALEDEQKRHRLLAEEHIFVKKRLEEQENHLRLLEQHLSRRVKECALLSKQLEEQMDRVSCAHTQLAAIEQKYAAQDAAFEQLQKAQYSLRKEYETESSHYQQERQDLLSLLETKEQELTQLRQVQQQFSELEHLFKKSSEIIATKPQEATIVFSPPKSQSDFFSQQHSQKPAKSTFFE